MKAKLFTLAVMVLAAGDLGYLLGRSAMKRAWHDSNVKVYEDVRHSDLLHEVSTDTEVLQYLADGNLSKAREVLERGLDAALVHLVSYEQLANPERRDGFDLKVVRAARDYRSHHPWASREEVQRVFKWAD
jgi:hypothetical protein